MYFFWRLWWFFRLWLGCFYVLKFSHVGFILNFLKVALRNLTAFLHSSLNHGLLYFVEVEVLGICSSAIFNSVFIIIIIIMSRRLRGYPWPSLATSPYHSSPPAGLQDYNPCPHIAAVCKFVLVVPLLQVEWGSTGVHRLWARPCFSSSSVFLLLKFGF